MIYFFDGTFDTDRLQWCKNNGIFYMFAWKALFPLFCFIPLFTTQKKFDKFLNKIIIFSTADAMAFKIRWS